MTLNVRKALASLLLAGFVSGCASNVVLDAPTIPTPMMDKIPASVGLRLPPNFYEFAHQEQVFGREEWSISLGDSNARLFSHLFGHMFDAVTLVGKDDDPKQMDIDAMIEPTIDAFEFSVPNQSKTDSFAVWIRYRVKVYDRAGKQVADWPVSAYGKSQTADISNSEALRRAAILAMRDAAALMIMKLDDVAKISTLAKLPAPEPEQAEAAAEEDVQATAVEGQEDESS